MRRRQIFEKRPKKGIFGHFLEKFDQKIAFFFGARSRFKISIDWRQKAPLEKDQSAKNGYLKIVQRGTLWVHSGSNPWGGGEASTPKSATVLTIYNIFDIRIK